jgi:competence protein ComFA
LGDFLKRLLYFGVSETRYVCPRCGNKDPRYLGTRNDLPYCRKCIAFSGEQAKPIVHNSERAEAVLHYSLSDEQKTLSRKIIQNFLAGVDTLVYAVCGAGKTELSYGVISCALEKGLQVGFALPRRDVVIELYWRIMEAFPKKRVVAVYGEHADVLEGDIVILTTHQLYRYPKYFDLLVMDEIDAFPYKGNDTLIAFYKKSLKGHCVMMSATPSKEILSEFRQPQHAVVELRTRFHKHPIPVPFVVIRPSFLQPLYFISKLRGFKKRGKPCFVFTPTIARSEEVFSLVSPFVSQGNYVNSERVGREEIITDFKKGKTKYLVTTSVLERGVTIKDLQVIVDGADNERIYDSSALVQISGRVGRKMDAPDGEVVFVAEKITEPMRSAIREIQFCNTFL